MGKKKETPAPPAPPEFANSVVKVDGTDVAKIYKDSAGQTVTEYYSTPEEKQLQDTTTQLLNEYLPKVNTLTPEYYAQKDALLKAEQERGIQLINDIYQPMIHNLQNDAASRFGTLNTSSFLDGLNNIEKQRSHAVGDFANNLLAESSQLDDNQLAKNYEFINLLQGNQNANTGNMYKAMSTNTALNSLINDFNTNSYNTASKNTDSSKNSSSFLPFYLQWFM